MLSRLSPYLAVLAVLGNTVNVCVARDEGPVRNYEEDLNDIATVVVRKFLPIFSEALTSPEVEPECSSALLKTFVGLQQQKAWALRMLMSNGMFSQNPLEGTYVAVGGYEQCLRTRMRLSDGELYFKGQYCSIFFELPRDYYVRFISRFHEIGELLGRLNPLTATSAQKYQSVETRGALCIPSLCTAEDINFIARSVLGLYGANATVTSCRTDDPKKITTLQAFSIAVISLLLLLVVLGSTAEWFLERGLSTEKKDCNDHGIPLRILLFFSAITNTRFLLKTELKPDNEPIRFLAGLKVIMAFWVVLGHAYILVQTGFFHALYAYADMTDEFTFNFIINAFLSVTTFFFLSGFVLGYLTTASRDIVVKNNFFIVFISRSFRRYVRLTIPMIVIMLAAFLLPLLGSGPADEDTYMQMIYGCVNNWWTVLVHTNNFNANRELCLQHFWYVSADLQIFVFIAFPLTLLLTKYPRIAVAMGVFIALAFCILTSIQIHSWDLFYALTGGTNDVRKSSRTLLLIYFRPFAHVGTYIMGVLCGYATIRHKNARIHLGVQGLLWFLSLGLACFIMFVTYHWNRGFLPEDVPNALYGGFHRALWGLVFFWPMYACSTGRGGWLNSFFGWSFFLPLSRLTFSIYMVHLPLYLLRSMRLRTYLNADQYFQFTTALGMFCLSTFFAYLLYLTVEAPVLRLDKMIFDRAPAAQKKEEGKLSLEIRDIKSQL